MNVQKVQRFSLAEIVLHWANAVLYLMLALTGAVMLLDRFLATERLPYERVSSVHRIAGIVLIAVLILTFILSLILKGFRELWNTLSHCLIWDRSDITWLIKVPLNTLFKRIALPPADRFNAGQKIHLLVVFVVLLGFALSGIIMFIVPGVLVAWVIHLACFLIAVLFLILHLFLSLINPSTRKSLPSIFTGFISADYIRQHHPRWLKVSETKPHGSYVSLRAILITILAAAGITLLLISFSDRKLIYTSFQKTAAQRGKNLILPGPLTQSHANDPDLEKCSSCHQQFLAPSSNTCLGCHEIIQHRMADRSGYHGTFTGACNSCHPEHLGRDADIRNFDTEQFDHSLANFKLLGAHTEISCQKCHLVKTDEQTERTKFIGLSYQKCVDCHTDPHQGRFERACTTCHSTNGWNEQDLIFSHDKDTDFKIDQIHSHLECSSCHTGVEAVLFKPLQTRCDKCHEDIERLASGIASQTVSIPDPHSGRVTCIQCHQADIQDQPQSVYANKCKSCHNDNYEQLYYDWRDVFQMRAREVEKLLLTLSDEDAPHLTQLTERIKEANKTGFHNINLANELWNQMSLEIPLTSE